MSSGFKNSDLFIKQSQKNPYSPYTPTTSVSVGLNGKRFPAKECISCVSSCSFPCWQHTLQNVLLQSTSCCVICLLPPILFLLKASSVPAHELDTRAVPLSRMGFQLEAVDVTSAAAAEPWPLREERRGHSPLIFFLPFSNRIHLLTFWGTHPLFSLVDRLCFGETRPQCAEIEN